MTESFSEEQLELVTLALRQADELVSRVIRADGTAHHAALELARSLNDLKRKHGMLKGVGR